MRALLPALLLVATGCVRDNASYCDAAHACASGAMCNMATNECQPVGGGDMSVDDMDGNNDDLTGADLLNNCPQACNGVTPICISASCAGCDTVGDGELACSTLTNSPHCQTSGPSQGACVQCRDNNDCFGTMSKCDPADHVCRACVADGDCTSQVCDLTFGSATQYQCVTNVVYVDCMNGSGGNDGKSTANPVDKISKGVSLAGTYGYNTIRVINTCGNENVDFNNVNLTLVGAGAAIHWSNGDNPAVKVEGTSQIVLRNFTISGGTGVNNGNGVLCTALSGSVTLLDCIINSNALYGVDGNNCGRVNIERSYIGGSSPGIPPNVAGGVRVGHAFHIIDNMIVQNGNTTMSSGGGVQILSPTNSSILDFTNNTVADNNGSGTNSGAFCMNAVTLKNTLLFNNKIQGVTLSETNCGLDHGASDDPLNTTAVVNLAISAPAFVGNNDYHLTATSSCIDKGTNNGIPAHDYDRQLRISPKSGIADIGADEFYP
jgi:hypothetical protein